MVAMRTHPDSLGFACEAINKMFTTGDTHLVRQVSHSIQTTARYYEDKIVAKKFSLFDKL